jgi:dipeptidyl aminopeptidase/acylaminoacyl peptidase
VRIDPNDPAMPRGAAIRAAVRRLLLLPAVHHAARRLPLLLAVRNVARRLLLLPAVHHAAWLAPLLLAGCFSSHPVTGSSPTTPVPPPRPAFTVEQLAAAADCTALAVTPDGRTAAFVTDRSGAEEVWTVSLGEDSSEPVRRTRAEGSIADLAWSPDSERLYFSIDHGGDERFDLWSLARADGPAERLIETDIAEREARISPDGRSMAFLADPDRPFRANLQVMTLSTRRTRPLTHEPVSVSSPRWSPDGRTLVATVSPDDQQGDLIVVDVSSGAVRHFQPPRPGGILRPVDFLPDGRLLALATNARGLLQLARVRLDAGAIELVGPDAWEVEYAVVLVDGTAVYSLNVHGRSEVWAHSSLAAPRRLLSGGEVTALACDRIDRRVFVLHTASNRPTALLEIYPDAGAIREIVPATAPGIDPDRLAKAERREISSFDGLVLDVYLWKPPVVRLGAPPPAVVLVHGGPESQVRDAFNPQAQALAEAGFVVVAPNYRGSGGYGRAFQDLDNRDWGGGDLKDLLASIDALIRTGEIDPDRIGVMGESFGGYLTLQAITAAPDRWRAAVDYYGMPDLLEDYRITEDRYGSWYLTEMGDPKANEALYRERSPLNALDRVRAPLLVLQGENDADVPKAESDLVVERLRARQHPVEYVVYPDEGHGFTRREHRLDAMSRTVAFFLHHLARSSEARP